MDRRKVEVFRDGAWVVVDGLRGVAKGDRFRMFKESGEFVDGPDGIVALTDPKPLDPNLPDGTLLVEV